MFLVLSSPSGSRRFFKYAYRELEKRRLKREYLLKKFYYLRDRKLIDFVEEGDRTKIVLNEKGKKRMLEYEFENMAIKAPQKWDRKWRVVIFDVPESQKKGRDALIRKLKDLGLVQFNKSVWVYPYECKDEIDFVSEYFDIGRHVHYLTVESMTNEENLRTLFEL